MRRYTGGRRQHVSMPNSSSSFPLRRYRFLPPFHASPRHAICILPASRHGKPQSTPQRPLPCKYTPNSVTLRDTAPPLAWYAESAYAAANVARAPYTPFIKDDEKHMKDSEMRLAAKDLRYERQIVARCTSRHSHPPIRLSAECEVTPFHPRRLDKQPRRPLSSIFERRSPSAADTPQQHLYDINRE